MSRKGESVEFCNSKGFDPVECDLEIFFGVAERLGKTGLLSTQLGKLPSPDTVFHSSVTGKSDFLIV